MSQVIVFLCGFVSFYLQLVATKSLLPLFGGNSTVWITSLLFFQGMLYVSYHVYYRFIKDRINTIKILGVISVGVNLLFNFYPIEIQTTEIISILIHLLLEFGLVYLWVLFLSPFFQKQKNEGFLSFYKLSNIGCFSALVLYPLILEPNFGVFNQKNILLIFVSIVLFLVFFIKNQGKELKIKNYPLKNNKLQILILSVLSSLLLSSFSHFLTQDIANFPLFWVVPLGIFLLGYIWAFSETQVGKTWMKEKGMIAFFLISLMVCVDFYLTNNIWIQTIVAFLFFGIMIFQVILKIKESFVGGNDEVVDFYKTTALGGLIGGIIINVVVIHFFTKVNDFAVFSVLSCVFLMLKDFNYKKIAVSLMMIGVLSYVSIAKNWYVIDSKRSFYGLVKIEWIGSLRKMYHGRIIHGQEDLTELGKAGFYYHKDVFIPQQERYPKRIAIVGLGAGMILSYFNDKNYEIDIYEIDQNIVDLAKKYFTFISLSKSKINIVVDDGRKGIINSKGNYDLIVLDAFSGDSIPSHLLTKEAFKSYKKKLSATGEILAHLSNNFIDLPPIVSKTAQSVGFLSYKSITTDNDVRAVWMNLIQDHEFEYSYDNSIWTDDYNSLFYHIKTNY